MDLYYEKQDNLDAIDTATGNLVKADRVVANPNKGVTLVAGTYVFMLKPAAKRRSLHYKWSAALAGVITIEGCDFPVKDPAGGADVADHSIVAGDWLLYNPAQTGAVWGSIVGGGGGSGIAALTVTIVAGAVGGGRITLPDLPGRRWRVKIVATAGGVLRVGESMGD